jgi:hypothetical protein
MGRRTNPADPPLVRVSAALTARENLLPIAAAAAKADQPVNATSAAAIAEVPVDVASRELRWLERMGFLRTIETDRANVDFEVVDQAAWSAMQELCSRAEQGALEPSA